MKKVVFLLLALAILFGCTNLSAEDIARSDPNVQNFLESYPDAQISFSTYTPKNIDKLTDTFPGCIIPPNEEYYLVTVNDNDSKVNLKILYHKSSAATICGIQEGKTTSSNNNTQLNIKTQNNVKENCEEDWVCEEWDTCEQGQSSRTCTDENDCGTEKDKPDETKDCCSVLCSEWEDNCEDKGIEIRACEFRNCDDDFINDYEIVRTCEVDQ